MPRPIKAIIDLAAMRNNLAVARTHAKNSRVFAVIKADAYGHGFERALRALRDADGIALLEIERAARARSNGYKKRIVLLEGVFDSRDMDIAAEHDLALVVHNDEQLKLLDAAPAGTRYDVLLKINTGMNRLGFADEDATRALRLLDGHRAVKKLTLMTHFATADDPQGVVWQTTEFERIVHGHASERSLANSAAVLRYPDTHADWIRPGIMLYGCTPFADAPAQSFGLQAAMSLESEIIAIQTLPAGGKVGYGSTFEARASMRVGVVACGYADGYPRHAPTGTPIVVGGRRTTTVGRVSMDMLCADLSIVPEAKVGSPVTLWGSSVSADEVAAAAGTVSYELLCALAPRVPVFERDA